MMARPLLVAAVGLTLVALLLFVSVFAYFFAPVDPKAQNVAFAPPDKVRQRESVTVDFNQRAHNSPELLSLEQFEQVDLADFYAALICRRVPGYVRLEVTRYRTIRHGQRKIPFQGREWSAEICRPRNIGFDRPLRNKMRHIRWSQFID